MLAQYADQAVDQIPALQKEGQQLSKFIHKLVLQGGEPARRIADLLHGTWLGHPLHPLLTDVVVGAWTMGALFDIISMTTNSRQAEQAADTLTAVGAIAALPTAASGAIDFSGIAKSAAGTALTHAIVTDASLSMYLLSLRARKKGQRSQGLMWSALGLGLITAGAYLGGHLVFGKKVGVNQAEALDKPKTWTALMAETKLPKRQPQPVEIEGQPALLYREGNQVSALSAVCPHAGGPLQEGSFEGNTVQCPWHDSVFDLRDGQVIHGPATYPVPCYEARIRNGQVEVRVPKA